VTAREVISGESVSAGVTRRFNVGVAMISEAGKEGAMKVAIKNSENTSARINRARPDACTSLR